MTRARLWVILLMAAAGCHLPRSAGPAASKTTDEPVDPSLLAEFQREVAANSAKAPSYGAGHVPHDEQPAPQAAALPFPFLEVTTTDVQTDGRIAKIRGRVANPYDEPVEGIRYLVFIGAPEGGDSHVELDRIASESGATIAPHDSAPMRLEVSSMYFGGAAPPPVVVAAAAKRIGGRELPAPEGFPRSRK